MAPRAAAQPHSLGDSPVRRRSIRNTLGIVGALALSLGGYCYLDTSTDSFAKRESEYPNFDARFKRLERALRRGTSTKAQVREALAADFPQLKVTDSGTSIEAGSLVFDFDARGVLTDFYLYVDPNPYNVVT